MRCVCFSGLQTSLHPVGARRRLGRMRAGKFDPDLLQSSKKGGRRKRVPKEEERFEGLETEKLYRGPKSHEYADEEFPHPVPQGVVHGALDRLFDQNAPLGNVYDQIFERKFKDSRSSFDYLEFRTFEAEGLGIDHISNFWEDFGYVKMGGDVLPEYKISYQWLAPPKGQQLPRIVISSMKMEDLSSETQEVLRKKMGDWPDIASKHVSGAMASRITPWGPPTLAEFEKVYDESEYASWILIHGYGVSCAALSVNEMQTPLYRFGKSPKPVRIEDIFEVCEEIPQVLMTPVDGNPEFIHVNETKTVKQIATLATILDYRFADGQRMAVPGSYLSYVERGPIPRADDKTGEESDQAQYQDGFDASLMRSVLDSTTLALPYTSQQIDFQNKVHKRARMDGYDLTGDASDPEQVRLVERYSALVAKDMEKERLRDAN